MTGFNYEKIFSYINIVINLIVINTISLFLIVFSMGTFTGSVILATNSTNKNLGKNILEIFDCYKEGFKRNFKQAFIFSFFSILLLVGVVVARILYLPMINAFYASILAGVYFIIIFIIVFISIYAYFLMEKFEMSLFQIYSQSLAISVYKFPQTIFLILINILMFIIITRIFSLLFIIIPIAVFVNAAFVEKIIDSIQKKKS
ncbi:MAG: hypothetical protein ACRC5R_04595 [Mycoplasmatales bacterium]